MNENLKDIILYSDEKFGEIIEYFVHNNIYTLKEIDYKL